MIISRRTIDVHAASGACHSLNWDLEGRPVPTIMARSMFSSCSDSTSGSRCLMLWPEDVVALSSEFSEAESLRKRVSGKQIVRVMKLKQVSARESQKKLRQPYLRHKVSCIRSKIGPT